MKYRGIIFDLDGTLIDSLADIAAATNRTLTAHGFPVHPDSAYRQFIGDGVRKLIQRALPDSARTSEAVISACIESYNADYGAHWNVQTALYPGIAEALDQLKALGLKLAVLSNKPDPFTQSCAAEFLKRWQFDVVMGASTRYPHKPDPTAALAIAATLHLKPTEMMYLGDMPVDMQTARNAGMLAIGATWGLRTREELEQAGAQKIVDHPDQLLRIA